MMNTDAELIAFPPTEAAAAAASFCLAAAVKLAAFALKQQPPEHQQRIMTAVDSGTCTLIVQTDLPSGDATVLADMHGGIASVLARMEPSTTESLPLTTLARSLADHGLARVAPDARRRLLAALDDGDASAVIIVMLPGCDLRVLVHLAGWSEPRELLRVELPNAPAATLN